MSGPASRIFRPFVASWNWLHMAWSKQPVLFVSAVMAIAGKDVCTAVLTFDLSLALYIYIGPVWVLVRPGTQVYVREIETWPSHYRSE